MYIHVYIYIYKILETVIYIYIVKQLFHVQYTSIYVMKICFTTPDMGCWKRRGLRHGGGRGQRQRRAGDNGPVAATFSISDSLKTEGLWIPSWDSPFIYLTISLALWFHYIITICLEVAFFRGFTCTVLGPQHESINWITCFLVWE